MKKEIEKIEDWEKKFDKSKVKKEIDSVIADSLWEHTGNPGRYEKDCKDWQDNVSSRVKSFIRQLLLRIRRDAYEMGGSEATMLWKQKLAQEKQKAIDNCLREHSFKCCQLLREAKQKWVEEIEKCFPKKCESGSKVKSMGKVFFKCEGKDCTDCLIQIRNNLETLKELLKT